MKKQIIKYESDTLLPDEISEKFSKAIHDINNVRYEDDKIRCIVSRLKGDMVKWLAENSQKNILE